MISLFTNPVGEIAVLGAHCDDIAIGMGGTLLALARAEAGLRVRALVLSGRGTDRATEEIAALSAFCPGSDVRVEVHDVPDGRGPAHWEQIKDIVTEFRRTCSPSVVFGPHRDDAHQDHRVLAELLPTAFRDHLILGYEILKWENDTPRPTLYHPLTSELAVAKATLLQKQYASQAARDWFDDAAFLGLSRLRGVQCRSPHAEAFVVEKAAIAFGQSSGGPHE